jgi:hypothetical protein
MLRPVPGEECNPYSFDFADGERRRRLTVRRIDTSFLDIVQ